MGYLTFDIFKKYPQLVSAVAKSDYGNMSFLYGPADEVKENRQHFFEALDIDQKQVVVASLVHGTKVIDPSTSDLGRGIVHGSDSVLGDIMATNNPGRFLFFVLADCIGIILFDPKNMAVCLAHSGWRGTNLEVPRVATEYMTNKYRTRPEDLLVAFTPAIHKESMNFKDVDELTNPRWQKFLHKNDDGSTQVDNIGFAKQQLLDIGVKEENIEISPINTRTSSEYFSHRRSVDEHEPERRFGVIAGLR